MSQDMAIQRTRAGSLEGPMTQRLRWICNATLTSGSTIETLSLSLEGLPRRNYRAHLPRPHSPLRAVHHILQHTPILHNRTSPSEIFDGCLDIHLSDSPYDIAHSSAVHPSHKKIQYVFLFDP